MKLILFRKYATAFCLAITLFITLFLFSCKKNINDAVDTVNTAPDLVTKVTSSVSGFVTDQNNAAVVGATVKAGGANTTTDKYGYFEFKNIQVVKEAATVEVLYAGYFKGIKTYMATEGKAAFFRIKLLQKTIAGTINATSGGDVSLSNGLNISLPANAVKNAATGSAYTGTVNVAAQFIDPTSNEVNNIMPGDLRGINADGNIKGLTSYGMMAVELTGASGELLQIADGKKAAITFPIPTSINSSAPAIIPLWYFNESNGLWKEEGTATKTGNSYVGEVGHFSFWNCDLPNAIVPLTFTIVDHNNNPVAFAHVEITPDTPFPSSHIGGYTDSTGYVSVFVTPNTTYNLLVNAGSGCGSHILQTFSVGTSAVDLGNIVIGTTSGIATINGTVTDCNGNPVTDGYITMLGNNDQYTRYGLNYTGSYGFNTFLCNDTVNVNFIAENTASGQQSQTITHTIYSGANSIPVIQACGVSTDVYLNFSINDRTFICGNQVASTAYLTGLYTDSFRTQVAWYTLETQNGLPIQNAVGNMNWSFWSFGIPGNASTSYFMEGIAPYNNILHFSVNISSLTYITQNNHREIPLILTEYGSPGQFVAGSFSGTFYEDVYGMPDMTRPYNVSCNFRIKRSQ